MLQQLTPRVYQLDFSQEQDRPVLGYIRGDRFSLMVDAGNSPEHVQAYLAAVEESGFCQPDFVALTHSHWDHCHKIRLPAAFRYRNSSVLKCAAPPGVYLLL